MPLLLGFLVALFGATFYYFSLPQLALDGAGMYLLLFFTAVAGACAAKCMEGLGALKGGRTSLTFAGAAVTMLVVLLLGALVTSGVLRANSYQHLLGEPVTKEFDAQLPPLDLQNAPLVSHDMAVRAAEKQLSSVPALGSQTTVGEMHKQLVQGKLYWVGLLEHSGFWKWLDSSGTPGYVRVSATDPSDVTLVTEIGGKKMHLRYLPSAYFGTEAARHLRFNGYATRSLSELTAEIDDEGRPYLVATVSVRRVGFSGHDAVGIVVLDVQTGESEYYPVAKAPAWVDRVQSAAFVKRQLRDYLEYVHGWWNPSHADMLEVSGEMDLIYGTDGRAHYFAGLGSTAREGGLVGFVLIDTRTKEVFRYMLPGVTESVAQRAAEGVLPEKKYSATNALPFMVDSIPAYVMALRDGTGIPRAYGVVDYRDFQKVAVAETLDAAVRQFQSKQNLDRSHTGTQARADELTLRAAIVRIGMEVRGGTSSFVFLLEGQGSQLYAADVNRADDLSVTRSGDVVEVRTLQARQRVQPVLEFRNLTLAGSQLPHKVSPTPQATAPM